jgi:hypothetical protein
MEITFVWSWLSFWIGVASVFMLSFTLMLFVALAQGVKKKKSASDLLDLEWARESK